MQVESSRGPLGKEAFADLVSEVLCEHLLTRSLSSLLHIGNQALSRHTTSEQVICDEDAIEATGTTMEILVLCIVPNFGKWRHDQRRWATETVEIEVLE